MHVSRRQFLLLDDPPPKVPDDTATSPFEPGDRRGEVDPTHFVRPRRQFIPTVVPGVGGRLRQAIGVQLEQLTRHFADWSRLVVDEYPRFTGWTRGWQTALRRRVSGRPWSKRSRLIQALLAVVILTVAIAYLTLALVSSYLTRDLPPVDQIFTGEMFQTAMVYDRKGRLLDEIIDPNGGRREVVPLRSIPRTLVDATVMTEDPSFYSNSGVDAFAILRALLQNIRNRRIVSGASTITQQLVRNVLMTPEEQQAQTLQRKLGEAILAYRVTQRYTKDDILARYLNEINYGNLAYGVNAASETYFGKPVQQLDLAEAALIAGLPQGPALYDPYQHPEAAKQRQLDVLALMVKHGAISQLEADAAAQEPLHYHSLLANMQAPHFVMDVRHYLEQRYTRGQIYQSGLRVYTTLDLDLQHQLEQIVQTHLPALVKDGANNAAIVVIDPKTGEILAMIGSADFSSDAIQGQVNLATAAREPGSTMMPFTYLLAFDQHLAMPATPLPDAPIQYSMGVGQPPYQPQDADGKFRGSVSARRALADALNIPALALLDRVGVVNLFETLRSVGITSLSESASYYGLALTLGDAPVRLVDLTRAYGVLANGGVQTGVSTHQGVIPLVETLKVTDAGGTALDTSGPSIGTRVASSQATWLVTDVLADATARSEVFGADSALTLPDRPAAVDEAFSPNRRDSWVIGYTPQVVVGVWVGNTDGKPMTSPSAANEAATLWHEAIEAALNGQPVEQFAQPPGLVRATVDASTGLLPMPGRPTVADWFIDGTVPTAQAPSPPTPQPPLPPTPPAAQPLKAEQSSPAPLPQHAAGPPPPPKPPPPPMPAPPHHNGGKSKQ